MLLVRRVARALAKQKAAGLCLDCGRCGIMLGVIGRMRG